MFTVYILYSAILDKHYIGYTGISLSKRIERHLFNHKGFTAKVKDWVLVYSEEFSEKSLAIKRENEIKSWKSKHKIKELIRKKS